MRRLAVFVALLVPHAALAAEVTGVAAGGREVFVRLAPGESLSVGDQVPWGPKRAVLQVAEVVGPRARLHSAEPAALRPRDRLVLPVAAHQPVAPQPMVGPQPWQVAPPPPADRDPLLQRQADAWQAALRVQQPWIEDAHVLGRSPPTRWSGQLTLVGVGMLDRGDGPAWGLLRIANRMEVRGLAGTPLAWRHDVALWLDHATGVPGSSPRRQAQVRQAELALVTTQTRPLGGTLGRTWAPDGTSAGTLDGATLRLRLTQGLEAVAFGGLLPSLASTAMELQAGRYGAAVQAQGQLGRWRSFGQASWSQARLGGAADRQLLGLVARADHARYGEAWAELELATSRADLSGTAWAGRDTGAAVRPTRALASWLGPNWSGWQGRIRYAYFRIEPTRELAWTLPGAEWNTSQSHQLYGGLDVPALRRVELQAAGWGSSSTSADPWESWRWGTLLRARLPAWPTPAWAWSATVLGQSGTTLSGGSFAIGSEWLPGEKWRWHARVRYALDRIETAGVRSDALDLRAGFDWGSLPWLVGVTVGGRQTLWTDAAVATDWLDVSLVVARRF